MDLSGYTPASLRRMAGNGMSLPSAGFTFLMSIFCLERNVNWSSLASLLGDSMET